MKAKIITVAIFGLVGIAILLGLGKWQMDRLAWKEGIIARIETRLSQTPTLIPRAPSEAMDEYLQVSATGALLEGELHVLTSAKPWGPGYRVIAPFVMLDGRVIMVDRGFVPEAEKDAIRPVTEEGETTSITGVLLWPNETDGFTPAPDKIANIWFARDVALMSDYLGTKPIMLVVSQETGSHPSEGLHPLPVTVNIKNDHLGYAITWFSLALVWAVMTIAVIMRIRKKGSI